MPLSGFRCLSSSFYLFILGFLVIWSSPESVSASSRSSTTQEVLFPVRALQQPSLLFQCTPGRFFFNCLTLFCQNEWICRPPVLFTLFVPSVAPRNHYLTTPRTAAWHSGVSANGCWLLAETLLVNACD